MNKTKEQLMNENTPYGTYGTHYFNLETGILPNIDESVTINGTIDCLNDIIIEKDVFTGHDVMILSGGHDYTKFGEDRKRTPAGGPIHIKEGAWLGSRCIILGGATIGKHSVIGAGAVVASKDIPDYQVWAGNPARFIKEIPHENI
jgi:acetyltransferase-like isoleucine patch superfamily enzyme